MHSASKIRRARSTIVPGRRMITSEVALHDCGMEVDQSYLNEKTIQSDDSSIMNSTRDEEEREMRRRGVSEQEIFKFQENRRREQLKNSERRLQEQKFGAKNFEELLARHEFSACESDGEEENRTIVIERNEEASKATFAVPALPKHILGKSMMSSPVGAKGSGKAGLSCSTPKGSKDVSMSSLRALDISHVVNTESLDSAKVTVQNKNIIIPVIPEESSLQKTHTIQRSDLEGTFIIKERSLERTFTVESEKEKEQSVEENQEGPSAEEDSESSLQKTFTAEHQLSDNSLLNIVRNKQAAAPVPVEAEEVPVAEASIQGGSKKPKKINLQDREKRIADLTSSLLTSMDDEIPSPGAHCFKNTRKKIRPSLQTPPRAKAISRLSTESDKEKTIDMLSIVEDGSMGGACSSGPSFVDAVSVNATQVSPIQEVPEPQTPKSSHHPLPSGNNTPCVESSRAKQHLDASAAITPRRNYERPTIASSMKNKNAADNEALLASLSKDRRPRRLPLDEDDVLEKSSVNVEMTEPEPEEVVETSHQDSGESPRHQRPSVAAVEVEMSALSFRGPSPNTNHVMDYDYHNDNGEEDADESEEPANANDTTPRLKLTRRQTQLMSNSMASEGPSRRRGFTDETVAEETWNPSLDEEPSRRTRGGRKGKNDGLQLKKRELIVPDDDAPAGVRRSTRTRVKPVRSWLGEQPVYVHSPNGGKRLKGVTEVVIKDKRLCKYRTADLKLATEREQKERAMKKERAAQKRADLAKYHKRGERMNESQDDIHTDDED